MTNQSQQHRRHWTKPLLASLMFRDSICVPEITQAVSSLKLIRPLQQNHVYANEPFEMPPCIFCYFNLVTGIRKAEVLLFYFATS